MPKDTSRARKPARRSPVKAAAPAAAGKYALQVIFDAEDLAMLEALEREEKLPRATLLKRLMRDEYRRRHPKA